MPTYRLLVRETTWTNHFVTAKDEEEARVLALAGSSYDTELMESDGEEIVSCEEWPRED